MAVDVPTTSVVTQLEAYQAAVLAAIRARFPIFKTVDAFPEERMPKEVELPAFFFEINELEAAPTHDAGTGQAPIDVRVECHLIFSFKTPGVKNWLKSLAADVLAFAKLNRWGVRCEPCQVIGAFPDSFHPDLVQFCVWRVEWHQVLDLGDSVWDALPGDPTSPPDKLFINAMVEPFDNAGGVPQPLPDVTTLPAPAAAVATQDSALLAWLD